MSPSEEFLKHAADCQQMARSTLEPDGAAVDRLCPTLRAPEPRPAARPAAQLDSRSTELAQCKLGPLRKRLRSPEVTRTSKVRPSR